MPEKKEKGIEILKLFVFFISWKNLTLPPLYLKGFLILSLILKNLYCIF
jgi:hypothetical protein